LGWLIVLACKGQSEGRARTPSGGRNPCAGAGESAAAVLAIRGLPQQQQLLLCAAMRALGAPAGCDTPAACTPCASPCPAQVLLKRQACASPATLDCARV